MTGSFRLRTSRGARRAAFAVLASSLIALSLSVAHAETFPLTADTQIVGTPGFYVAKAGDTLLDVARDNDLGYAQLMTSNRDMDPWRPGDGHAVFLPNVYLLPPGPRKGIVIDLAGQRLYYFPKEARRWKPIRSGRAPKRA